MFPGGLGVIEGTVSMALSKGHDLIGPLIAFRAVYFLLPLMVGLLVFRDCRNWCFRRSGSTADTQGR